MKLQWTPGALQDLTGLRRYISDHDPQAAEATAKRILEAVERLTTFPASGRPGRVPDTRELVVPGTPYIVVYRVHLEVTQVLRVFHSGQHWPKNKD